MNNQKNQFELPTIVIQLELDFDQEFEEQEKNIEDTSYEPKTGKVISMVDYQEKEKFKAYRKILNNAKNNRV